MKLNQSKCHAMVSSRSSQLHRFKVGEQVIWESQHEKLLGVTIDNDLKFELHLSNICKKSSAKLTALGRLVKIIPMEKKKILMNSFIQSQFSYCPLVWMFYNKAFTKKINRIHERGLRMVYRDYESSFQELLLKDGSVCIHHRNIQLVAVEMYKVKHDLCPEIMKELFQFDENPESSNVFIRPRVYSVYKGEWSLRWFGPTVWDKMLPENYKKIENLENFKEDIKKWTPENCPCKTCKEFTHGVGYLNVVEYKKILILSVQIMSKLFSVD